MENILAYWRYAPDEWQDFTEFERGSRGREIGDILRDNILLVSVFVALSMVCALPAGVVGMLGIGLFVTALLFLAAFIHRAARNHEISILKSRPGEVRITLNSVSMNGLLFDWEFEGNRSRLVSITRRKTYTERGELNILEFKCVVRVRVNSTYQNYDKQWRVPVPRGKELEADVLIQKIYEARAAFVRSHNLTSDNPLGISAQIDASEHDFTASTVCLNCGSSIEAVTQFQWKCKK
jgi:hypothetical protein